MGIEAVIGLVALVATVLIGAWQIHLARKQIGASHQNKPTTSTSSSTSSPPANSSSMNRRNRSLPRLKKSSLVFVSGNKSKLEEFRSLLNNPDLVFSEIHTPEFFDVSLESLVRHKIAFSKKVLPPDTPFFVEHTALTIDAWNGLPGGLTKQFMETVGSNGICRMMKDFKRNERITRARTMIGFSHGTKIQLFEGIVVGKIAESPCGEFGFAWDNIFIPDGETKTFAELGQVRKDEISMRRKAVELFRSYLNEHYLMV